MRRWWGGERRAERPRRAAETAERREAGCVALPRVSIASVSKWSWSVICVRAGPLSPRVRHSPFLFLFYTRVPFRLSFFLSLYSVHLAFLSSRYRRIRFVARSVRDRVYPDLPVSFPGPLFSGTREIHVHDNRERKRGRESATVWSCYQWRRSTKINLYKRPCLTTTVIHHRRQPPTPTSDNPASPSKYVAFLRAILNTVQFCAYTRNIMYNRVFFFLTRS